MFCVLPDGLVREKGGWRDAYSKENTPCRFPEKKKPNKQTKQNKTSQLRIRGGYRNEVWVLGVEF